MLRDSGSALPLSASVVVVSPLGPRRLCFVRHFIKITIQMATSISVAMTPTRAPSNGVSWTNTAVEDAICCFQVKFFVVDVKGRSEFVVVVSKKVFRVQIGTREMHDG